MAFEFVFEFLKLSGDIIENMFDQVAFPLFFFRYFSVAKQRLNDVDWCD